MKRTIIVDVSPTITAGAYSAGDVIGGKLTLDVGGVPDGKLSSVFIVDDDAIDAAMKIYFFNENVATIADNAPFSLAIADLKKIVGRVAVAGGDYVTIGADSVAIKHLADTQTIPYASLNGIVDTYAVVDATPTYTTATALTFRFVFEVYDE